MSQTPCIVHENFFLLASVEAYKSILGFLSNFKTVGGILFCVLVVCLFCFALFCFFLPHK